MIPVLGVSEADLEHQHHQSQISEAKQLAEPCCPAGLFVIWVTSSLHVTFVHSIDAPTHFFFSTNIPKNLYF